MKNLYKTALILCFMTISALASAAIRYVKPTATGNGSGSSWNNASSDLQATINASSPADEVWVAAGTYVGSITMKEGVKIYGGFAGTETASYSRNWNINVTTLAGNGATAVYNYFTNNALTAAAVLDGFTLRSDSNTTDAIYNVNASPTINNCKITASRMGIYNYTNSSPVITNSIFFNNSTGLYNVAGSGSFINCTFQGNTDFGISIAGGSPTVQNCIVADSYTGAASVSYSLIKGQAGGTNGNLDGTNLVAANVFASTNPTDSNYLRLKAGSPAIDKGSNAANTTPADLGRNNRIAGGAIDLGAYEYASTTYLGTGETTAKSRISLYPNPAQSDVFVETDGRGTLGIYDTAGKLVKSATLQSGKNTVDIAPLPRGVYIFRIATEAGVQSQKVIKN